MHCAFRPRLQFDWSALSLENGKCLASVRQFWNKYEFKRIIICSSAPVTL